MKFLDSIRPQIIAATRIAIGFLFAQHGFVKFFGVLGDKPDELGWFLTLGGAIELVGGALVCIGLQTRLAAFICSGTMAVAYFLYHQSYGLLPIGRSARARAGREGSRPPPRRSRSTDRLIGESGASDFLLDARGYGALEDRLPGFGVVGGHPAFAGFGDFDHPVALRPVQHLDDSTRPTHPDLID